MRSFGFSAGLLLLSSVAIAASDPNHPATVELSPAAEDIVARVHDEYEKVEQEQALLPPAQNDSERLIRLGEIDQAARADYQKIDFSVLPPDQSKAAVATVWDEISRNDIADQKAVEAMMPPGSWFSISKYGEKAATAAFLIVQHSVAATGPVYDKELQHKALAGMQPLIATNDVNRQAYAMLYDRVTSEEGGLQRYGSNMWCKGHKWVPAPMEDPEHVNERRKEMGFAQSFEENLARFAAYPPCPEDHK